MNVPAAGVKLKLNKQELNKLIQSIENKKKRHAMNELIIFKTAIGAEGQ